MATKNLAAKRYQRAYENQYILKEKLIKNEKKNFSKI